MKRIINNLNQLMITSITLLGGKIEIRTSCGERLLIGPNPTNIYDLAVIEQTNTIMSPREIDEVIAYRHELERNVTMTKYKDLQKKLTKLGML